MPPPDSPSTHLHSPRYSCKDCPSANIILSSTPPRVSNETANYLHTPHTLHTIFEVRDQVSPDSDSGDDVRKQLKNLVARDAGTPTAGSRDTIDSILLLYHQRFEDQQDNSKSSTETEVKMARHEDVLDPHSFGNTPGDILSLEVGPPRTNVSEQSQTLHCSHCSENFHFTYSENALRVTAREKVDMDSQKPMLSLERTNRTSGFAQTHHNFDDSGIVIEDTTWSTLDHGTASSSNTDINKDAQYLLQDTECFAKHEEPDLLVQVQIQHENSSCNSTTGSKISTPHMPRLRHGEVEHLLDNHWVYLKESQMAPVLPFPDPSLELGTIPNPDSDEKVDEKDFREIGKLLQNLGDAQRRMDDVLAKHGVFHVSRKSTYVGSQIPNETDAVCESGSKDEKAVGKEELMKEKLETLEGLGGIKNEVDKDAAPHDQQVAGVVDAVELIADKTGKDESMKLVTVNVTDGLDANPSAEFLLTGALCTMIGLVFAAGALSA